MKEKQLNNKQLLDFGRSLKKARIEAGYNSLSSGIEGIKKLNTSLSFSRATLNLIENGNISDINTEFLKVLCKAYSLNYRAKLKEYLKIRYELPQSFFGMESKILKKIDRDSLELYPDSDKDQSIELLSVERFRKVQGELPGASIVGVSAISFLDDHKFFDMVLANIKKGVRYYYYLPEGSEIRYRQFIAKLSTSLLIPSQKIDEHKCFYIKRSPAEFPLVSVVFIKPNNIIEGFMGLSSGDNVQYFQRADSLLSWRLYQAFLMAFSLSSDTEIQGRRNQINLDLKDVKEIRGFPVLMGSLGV